MSGLGSVICGAWLPWPGELFNHAGWFFMVCMTKASEWAADLPGGYYYVAAPGLALVALFYGALCALLGGWFRERFRWWVAGGLGLLAAAWVGLNIHARAATRITIDHKLGATLDERSNRDSDRRARLENTWLQRPKLVMALTLGLTVLALFSARKVGFDYNLLHMQSAGLPAVIFQDKLIQSSTRSVLYGAINPAK